MAEVKGATKKKVYGPCFDCGERWVYFSCDGVTKPISFGMSKEEVKGNLCGRYLCGDCARGSQALYGLDLCKGHRSVPTGAPDALEARMKREAQPELEVIYCAWCGFGVKSTENQANIVTKGGRRMTFHRKPCVPQIIKAIQEARGVSSGMEG